MKIALLADIHSNLEALNACLAHAARQGADSHAFLGDLVGYGADPVACLDIIAEMADQGAIVLKGNHDEAALGGLIETMHFVARDAIYWTREHLGEQERRFLEGLPLTAEREGCLFVHAEPLHPGAFTYVTDAGQAAQSLQSTRARVVFAGHVHHAVLYFTTSQGAKAFIPTPAMPIPLTDQRQWFAIVGSVGQPRDNNPAAGYALLDMEKNTLTYHRVPYDFETAARKIRAAGLPERLAVRLSHGH
jgi:diadenosine tetraphosphatase ApaH/serine/threonine PP2A family protein phosphatase